MVIMCSTFGHAKGWRLPPNNPMHEEECEGPRCGWWLFGEVVNPPTQEHTHINEASAHESRPQFG